MLADSCYIKTLELLCQEYVWHIGSVSVVAIFNILVVGGVRPLVRHDPIPSVFRPRVRHDPIPSVIRPRVRHDPIPLGIRIRVKVKVSYTTHLDTPDTITSKSLSKHDFSTC